MDFDPCECVFNHEAAMSRLLNWVCKRHHCTNLLPVTNFFLLWCSCATHRTTARAQSVQPRRAALRWTARFQCGSSHLVGFYLLPRCSLWGQLPYVVIRTQRTSVVARRQVVIAMTTTVRIRPRFSKRLANADRQITSSRLLDVHWLVIGDLVR